MASELLDAIEASYSRGPDVVRLSHGVEYVVRGDLVAITGTNEFRDWLRNVSAWTTPVRDQMSLHATGRAHAGYWSAAIQVARDVQSRWTPAMRLCGHSLGGAVAVLAGAILADRESHPVRVVTLGRPPCCDRQLATYLDAIAVDEDRIVAWGDPVPWGHPWLAMSGDLRLVGRWWHVLTAMPRAAAQLAALNLSAPHHAVAHYRRMLA